MKIISSKNKLLKIINKEKNLGFVPTMGSIHMGHVSLIKKCIKQSNKTIVTIFVNKPQFNRKNDYKKYPRNIKNDIKKLKKLKIDILYIPKESEIYPTGINKKIKIDNFEKELCGKYRPGHFKGIVDVIERFIKIINPMKIFFGEKDMQQLKIIKAFTKKNYPNIKIISCKTIREKNGIALSSRNLLLSKKEKEIGSKIFRYVFKNKKQIIKNIIPIKKVKKVIKNLGVNKIDYVEVLNVNKLVKPFKKGKKFKVFIAYFLGQIRLIDNI